MKLHMDHTRYAQAHQNPNPNQQSDPSSYSQIYASHFPYFQNPIPNLTDQHSSATHAASVIDPSAYQNQYDNQTAAAYGQGYYSDPTAAWAAKEAVRNYGANTAAAYASAGFTSEQLAAAAAAAAAASASVQMHNPTSWSNLTYRAAKGAWKNIPKKIKVVQSVYCEVCKLDCNSQDVLNKHKLGKKHQKNLEILHGTYKPPPVPVPAPTPTPTPTLMKNPSIGPPENPNAKGKAALGVGGVVNTRKALGIAEDLETKKRKIIGGGAAMHSVRACAVCNVVCNSDTVFKFHLSGQKHAAMMKKLTGGPGAS